MAFRVTRADVAAVILQEVTDDRFLGQAVYIASAWADETDSTDLDDAERLTLQ